MTHATKPRPRRSMRRAAALAPLAIAAATALAGCADTSGIEARHASRAADQCVTRVGIQRVDSPQGPAIGAAEKPFYAAQVVGASGVPPWALGYGDAKAGTSVTFAIVPGDQNPDGSTTFATATKDATHAAFLLVPQAKIVETERCLGGSAPG